MRDYLERFFADFSYEKEDAAHLLCAYDTIASNDRAAALLHECIALYEKDHHLDYKKEILETRAKMIAEETALHPYTVELLMFICFSRHLRALYADKDLSPTIYRDSMLDLKWKLIECKLVKGICGSFVAAWFPGFFDLTRFSLGRLQFEIVDFGHHYDKNGIVLTPETKVINVHIPRTGGPMDKKSCDDSYAQARAFFADVVGESAPFVCHSWLLFPEHREMLSPTSNIYRFMSEYEILESGVNSGYDLWRFFDTDEKDPEKLPTNTSLRRAYVAYLKNGGKPGWGFGVKFN